MGAGFTCADLQRPIGCGMHCTIHGSGLTPAFRRNGTPGVTYRVKAAKKCNKEEVPVTSNKVTLESCVDPGGRQEVCLLLSGSVLMTAIALKGRGHLGMDCQAASLFHLRDAGL